MKRPDMPFVFICHSHPEEDRHFSKLIDGLKRGLENRGIECFVDHESFRGGDVWQEKLLKELARADAIIVVASKELVCSNYCGLERGFAYARNIPELIITLEDAATKEAEKLQAFVSTQTLDKYVFQDDWWDELIAFGIIP